MLIFELLVVCLLAELFGNPEQLSFGLTHIRPAVSSVRAILLKCGIASLTFALMPGGACFARPSLSYPL